MNYESKVQELLHALETDSELSANYAKTCALLRSKKRVGKYSSEIALNLILTNVRSAARKLAGDDAVREYPPSLRAHTGRVLRDRFETKSTKPPRKHRVARQGDEYACSCGARWDVSEGDSHP